MSDVPNGFGDLSKREQVDCLRRKYEKADSLVKGTASGGLDIVRSGFNSTHFPLELIQNADDEGANNLLFEVDEENGKLYVFDDGEGFDQEGVIAVCQQGQSPKDPRQQIGFMGIGFKSIFEISDDVRIYSNDYRFGFSLEGEDGSGGLDAVTPHWVSEGQLPEPKTVQQAGYTTRIVASISDERNKGIEEVKEALEGNNLSPSVFLFLDSLGSIEVRSRQDESFGRHLRGGHVNESDEPDGVSEARELYKEYAEGDPENKLGDGDLVQVRRTGDGDSEEQWVVFRDIWDVGDDIRRPRLRKNLETSDLFIAFRIAQNGRLLELEDGGSVRISPVHSYLPLSELDVDIDFLIHADFDLDPSREGIRSESEWNNRAAEVVRQQCLQNVLEVINDHSEWWRQSHLMIPQSQHGNNIIISDILEKFRRGFAESYDFVRDMDCQNVVSVSKARDFTDYARDSLGSDEIEQITGYRPVHPDQREVLNRFRRPKTRKLAWILKNSNAPDVLENHTDREDSTDWFARLYQNLAAEKNETKADRMVAKALSNRIILTGTEELSVGRSSSRQDNWEVFIPTGDGSGSAPFDDSPDFLDTVAPDVLETEDSESPVEDLFKEFGAEPVTPDRMISEGLSEDKSSLSRDDCVSILDAISDSDNIRTGISAWLTELEHEIREISRLRNLAHLCKDGISFSDCVDWTRNHWNQLSDSERRASIRMCKIAYSKSSVKSFSFLRFPTDSGWSRPENVLPSAEFSPDYNFEMIRREYSSSLRKRDLGLIDGSIIEDDSGWQDFLDHLGIPDSSKLGLLAGDVGEEFVEDVVDEHFNKVLHEVEHGMDFESGDGELRIEVKSTKSRTKESVRLTSTQYDEIRETSNEPNIDYYVYPVVNALTDPEIRPSPINGEKLLDEVDSISVDITTFQ